MNKIIKLPAAKFDGPTSVEKALQNRMSLRNYKNEGLTLAEISQLLWAAQGVTHPAGLRTAPSAGALYPLEVYLVAGNVQGLEPGIYHYQPQNHTLVKRAAGEQRDKLCQAALGQDSVKTGPAALIFSAVFERTTSKYGERGQRYVFMEAGQASQNVCLQAVSLNLGTVVIGAFYDSEVKKILQLPANESVLYIMPVGRW